MVHKLCWKRVDVGCMSVSSCCILGGGLRYTRVWDGRYRNGWGKNLEQGQPKGRCVDASLLGISDNEVLHGGPIASELPAKVKQKINFYHECPPWDDQ